jgi:hypothetical protein
MDPFLELPAYWSDFHSTFINYWREAIADALPPNYEATLGERVYLVEHDPEARRLGYPGVAVTEGELSAPGAVRAAGAATLEPVTIPLRILEGPRETYIEILHQPERRLVTALELLSPANKEQPGRTEYLAKRRALLYQDVHVIELDLLLGGQRLPWQEPLPRGDYYYLLCRGDQRPNCEVYSWPLPQPLPTLPVPLRAPDADIFINLATVLATAYERGRFRRRLPYRGSLPAFLPESSHAWVASVLEAQDLSW